VEKFEYIDIMRTSGMRGPSRWNDADSGEGAIGTLDTVLAKAGLPGLLDPALVQLRRIEEVVGAARFKRDEARRRLEEANRALLADGVIDLDVYADVLRDVAPWIDEDGPASVGVGDAGRQLRVRAIMTVFGMASGIYQRLRDHAKDIVREIAAVDLPAGVWQLGSNSEAAALMAREGRDVGYGRLVRANDQWVNVLEAAKLLRETGQFEAELMFPGGCPVDLGTVYLNWEAPAGEVEQLRQVPPVLRVRRAHDLGWRPGVWLKSDHERYAQEAKPRRGLLAGLVGAK
jgi:hypothetical protein